jgi:hypothetical protein
MCILAEGDEAGYETPSDLETREPEAGSNIGDDDLGWNEHQTVGYAEECGEAAR